MERQQLFNFQKVAQYNNMSKAAKDLHITQPALSKSIAGLESELGIQLFHRYGKKIQLNENGSKILIHVDCILNELSNIYHIASKTKQQKCVHILAKAADQLIPEIVFRFNESHPGIKIQVSHYSTNQTPDIVVTSGLYEYDEDDGLTVLKENFVLVVPSSHPLAKQENAKLSDLKNEPIVILGEGIPLRGIIQHWLKEAGVDVPFSYECDSCGAMRELINSGRGVGMVPSKTWTFPYNKNIRIIPIENHDCYRYVNVICPSLQQNMDVTAVYRFMITYFEKFNID